MKIVADTNVLISALGWNGFEWQIVLQALEGKVKLAISTDILDEFKEVASRAKFGHLQNRTDAFTSALLEASELVMPREKINAVAKDSTDDKILECAVEAKADIIVSGDGHLLELKEFRGIKIMPARKALELIQKN